MSLHKIFLHFHNEFQSMYQLLFSFRLASSDGLFIVNVVKSRSILGKSLWCNTTKSIRDIRTIYVVNLNLVTIRNNTRNTHILTYTTSCVSNARSNRKKDLLPNYINVIHLCHACFFFRTWQFLDA